MTFFEAFSRNPLWLISLGLLASGLALTTNTVSALSGLKPHHVFYYIVNSLFFLSWLFALARRTKREEEE